MSYEDSEYRVYPTLNPDDGSVTVPDDLSEKCLLIYDNELQDNLTDFSKGVFHAVNTIMAAPLVSLNDTLHELLDSIISTEDIEEEEEEDDEEANETCGLTKDTAPKHIANPIIPPPSTEDISDDELLEQLAHKGKRA